VRGLSGCRGGDAPEDPLEAHGNHGNEDGSDG
jgi:hypothetical protein